MGDPTRLTHFVVHSQDGLIDALASAKTVADGVVIDIVPGTYSFVQKPNGLGAGLESTILMQSMSRVLIRGMAGQRTKIKFVSSSGQPSPANCFLLQDCSQIYFENLEFEGTTTDDNLATNNRAAVYAYGSTNTTRIQGSAFDHCAPFTSALTVFTGRLTFVDNEVYNAPNAVAPVTDAYIAGNKFINTALVSTRSHAIYVFGRFGRTVVENNFFYRIGDQGHVIKWKGNTGDYERKAQLVVSGNVMEECYSGGEIGSDTEVVHESIVYTANTLRNCQLGFYGFVLTDAVVAQNQFIYDWRNPFTSCSAIQVQSTTIGSPGAIATSKNVSIHGNDIANYASVIGLVNINSVSADNDTITVGATTYTWKTSPASSTEIARGASASAAAVNLADVLRGRRSSPASVKNALFADPSDVQVTDSSASQQQVVLNSYTTTGTTLSVTGTAVVVAQAFTDYRAKAGVGISAFSLLGPLDIAQNTIRDFTIAINVAHCVRPRIRGNTIHGSTNPSGSTPYWVYCFGNRESEFTGNRLTLTPATQDTAGRRVDINDAFPLIAGNLGIATFANTKTKSDLLGQSGYITAGDGKARVLLYFGEDAIGGTDPYNVVQSLPLTWRDGDTVVVNDAVGHVYTFTFKRTSPNPANKEFNTKNTDDASHTGLVGLIDATTEFACTDYDALSYGYLEIKFASTGTGGNSAFVEVTTKSSTCGVVLPDTITGFINKAFLRAGSAAADRTFIFTPLAQAYRPCLLQGTDANGVALTGLAAYEADVVTGIGYLVRHSAASAGTRLSFAVQ